MHSNRDAKRIARRCGHHSAAASAIVDPEDLSAYRVSTEKKVPARHASGGWKSSCPPDPSTDKNYYTNYFVAGYPLFSKTSRLHSLTLPDQGTSTSQIFPKKSSSHEGN